MNTDDDMDKPVTRRELREELAPFATRKELREELAPFATRKELREELGLLREEMAHLATRKELEAWGGALNAKIDANQKTLREELARHANAIIEATRDIVKAALDPHRGVPERVAALEAQRLPERVAALEAQQPAPRRQRRRS